MKTPDQKQPLSQVEQAQAAIEVVATEPTLGDLQSWLLGSQKEALWDMNNSTGDAFGKHCDAFIELTTAYQVFKRFVALNRG